MLVNRALSITKEKKRVVAYRVLLLFGSTLIAVLIAEVACRALFPPRPSIRFQQDVDELNELSLNEAAAMIQDDPELFWRLTPNTTISPDSWPFFGIISNGQSLREDHEIALDKPKDQLRILFLGDSCTFGYGVAHEEAFVEVTESILLERLQSPVECINAGVPGYTIFQGYRYLVTEGLNYQPDLVVLNFGWNDYGMWDQFGDREHFAQLKAMQPPVALRGSRLSHLIWAAVNKPNIPDITAAKRPRMLPEEFAETLDEIHTLLEEQNIPLLILVWPMQANAAPTTPPEARTSLQKEMISFGQAHLLSTSPSVSGVLDLVPLGRDLVRENGAQGIYFDAGHVRPIAHRVIGKAIADHLSPWLEN